MDVQGKVALVTGGASGIGFAICHEFLSNGAKGVVIADCDRIKGIESFTTLSNEFNKDSVLFLRTDITDNEQFEDAFIQTIEKFEQLDIVVNNAGIINDNDYELCIQTNLIGTTRGTILGLKYLGKNAKGNGGIIINIASIGAWEYIHATPIYAATKIGIINLSKGFGHPFHYNKTGVKIITLCPGPTITSIHNSAEFLEGCFEDILRNVMAEGKYQLPPAVAKRMNYILKHGESTDVFLTHGDGLYKINDINLNDCKELVNIDKE